METSSSLKTLITSFLVLLSCVQVAFGGIVCETLDKDACAFAVSSAGKRCVLEKHAGEGVHTCRTSEIEAEGVKNWVEGDGCVEACGLDRNTLGISSDLLFDPYFVEKLCSSQCYQNCPNVVGLYFNLAAGEGIFLPNLCQPRREMAEVSSSGMIAPVSAQLPIVSQPPVYD